MNVASDQLNRNLDMETSSAMQQLFSVDGAFAETETPVQSNPSRGESEQRFELPFARLQDHYCRPINRFLAGLLDLDDKPPHHRVEPE
jgi:hypothetical protein